MSTPLKVRQKTQRLLYKEIERGKITKPTQCEICEKEFNWFGINGHHPDYTQPLKVIWCCHCCHGLIHAHNLDNTFNKVKIKQKLKRKINRSVHLPGILKNLTKNEKKQENLTSPIEPIEIRLSRIPFFNQIYTH